MHYQLLPFNEKSQYKSHEMVDEKPVRTYEVNQVFDLLKAFGFSERVVKSKYFFLGKDVFYFICTQHVMSYHLK